MHSRRAFLLMSAGTGALLAVGVPVFARGVPSARAAVAKSPARGLGYAGLNGCARSGVGPTCARCSWSY